MQVSNARDRSLKRWRGIIGRAANFHSIMMNTMSARMPRTRRMMTRGEDHGNDDPPKDIGTRMKIVATRDAKDPKKSTFLSFDLKEPVTGFNGRKKMICSKDSELIGTVTQNTHRHFCQTIQIGNYSRFLSKHTTKQRSDRSASGNTNPDKSLKLHQRTPKTTFPRFSKEVISLMIINTSTLTPPPPIPAITRNTINSAKLFENPHNKFPNVKMAIAMTKRIFLPKISEKREYITCEEVLINVLLRGLLCDEVGCSNPRYSGT
jgi:hypothetical protein